MEEDIDPSLCVYGQTILSIASPAAQLTSWVTDNAAGMVDPAGISSNVAFYSQALTNPSTFDPTTNASMAASFYFIKISP